MRILVALLAHVSRRWPSGRRSTNRSSPGLEGEIRGWPIAIGLYSEFDKDNNVTDELIRRDLAQLSKMTSASAPTRSTTTTTEFLTSPRSSA